MTVRTGFIKTILLTLLAVMIGLPVRSQTDSGIRFREDSVRSARMDSIYRSLNGAEGMSVVNIDNGFGAGVMACRILRLINRKK